MNLFNILRGRVMNNKDPEQRGRCQVFIEGIHSDEQTPNLPWAEVVGSSAFGLSDGVGVSSVLLIGTAVWVTFEQDDINCPLILGIRITSGASQEADAKSSEIEGGAKEGKYITNQVIKTTQGHKIELDDSDGSNAVRITTAKGQKIILDDEKGEILIQNDEKSYIKIKDDGIEMKSPKIDMQGTIIDVRRYS